MASLKGSNILKIKEINKSSILRSLFLYCPISRIEISELTGLTPPTITTNIQSLLQLGLVKELNEAQPALQETQVGRKPVLLDLVEDSFFSVGADWGPTGLYFCITDIRGTIKAKQNVFPKDWEFNNIVELTKNTVNQMIKESGIERKKIIGLGVAIPGFVESEAGIVRYSPAFGWKNVEVKALLSKELKMPVVVENNVRAMAAGEMLFSRKERSDIFCYIYIGRGIACAIIIDNELVQGSRFGAGELGHTVVEIDGPKCRCGNHGCLESFSSEYSIRVRAKQLLDNERDSILKMVCADSNDPNIDEIIEAFELGARGTSIILYEAVKYLGAAIANLVNSIDPKMIIIDGRIFSSQQLQDKLIENIKNHAFALRDGELKIEFRPHVREFCAVGASALAISTFLIK